MQRNLLKVTKIIQRKLHSDNSKWQIYSYLLDINFKIAKIKEIEEITQTIWKFDV